MIRGCQDSPFSVREHITKCPHIRRYKGIVYFLLGTEIVFHLCLYLFSCDNDRPLYRLRCAMLHCSNLIVVQIIFVYLLLLTVPLHSFPQGILPHRLSNGRLILYSDKKRQKKIRKGCQANADMGIIISIMQIFDICFQGIRVPCRSKDFPFSQLEIVCLETFRFSAACSCVYSFSLRAFLIFSPIIMFSFAYEFIKLLSCFLSNAFYKRENICKNAYTFGSSCMITDIKSGIPSICTD